MRRDRQDLFEPLLDSAWRWRYIDEGMFEKVNEMIPVCEAMATLALADSSNLKVLSEACLAFCKDCAVACEEHMDEHQECKDFYDACENSIEVVEAHLKAA